MLRKILNKLAFSFITLIAIFFVFILRTNNEVYASELIGTHLGEGDIGFQTEIIRTVLIPNGLEAGSPVTAMVGVNNLQPSQKDSLIQLADMIRTGNFFPIIRINDVCDPFEGGLTPVGAVQTAKEIFGNDAIIVWGNEVNNKEAECSDWAKYVRDFKQIQNAGLSNVSPAALDYYMGKTEYSVAEFMKTPGAEAVFGSAPRVANAYGCVGSKEPSCTSPDWGGNTEARGFDSAKSKGTFYLTEFSLSPEGRAVDAPDTSLAKVIQFINDRASQTGAAKITPLIRNTCNDESQWLIYVNGKVFTPLGTEVTENCSGKAGAGGYDLSKYPTYGIDPNLFFLTPLRYTDNSKFGSSSAGKQMQLSFLRKELVNQGYQAYCASDNVKIKTNISPENLVQKFLNKNRDGINLAPVESKASVSTKNAQYPLWRDTEDKKFLTSSLEEYFGFKDVYIKDPTTAEITSAPINSLLSQKQMCVQGWRNLVAQQLACERLSDPSQCSLLGRPIPETRFTVNTLLDEIAKFEPAYRDGGETKGCEKLFSSTYEKDPDAIKMLEGLVNTPTYIDTAYRYGFIVAAIETKPPAKDSRGWAQNLFNFFTGKTEDNSPKHEVLVSAFKLPDIGTNKGGGDDTGHQFFNDSLDLTRKVLTNTKQIDLHENIRRDEKRRNNLIAATNVNVQNENNRIFCYDGIFGSGTGTTTCEIPLSKALTDIINANADGCGEAEDVRSITTAAGLGDITDETGKVFNNDNGGQVLQNLFLGDETHLTTNNGEYDPQVAETTKEDPITSLFSVTQDTWDHRQGNMDTNVNYYIVYPMGYELEHVEKAIQGAFFSSEQIATMNNDQTLKHGFKFNGVNMSIDTGSSGWGFEDNTGNEEDKTCIDPETGEPIYCNKDISIDMEQDGKAGAGILGGKLGYIMRNAQVALSSRASDAYSYFTSCKTTEEFLLGKCRGGKTNSDDTNFDYETCGMELGTGFCAPDNLQIYFEEENEKALAEGKEPPFENPALEADKASRICQRESRSSPRANNFNCLAENGGKTADYSIGLFQINLLPRCRDEETKEFAFTDINGKVFSAPPYELPCIIANQEAVNSCQEPYLVTSNMSDDEVAEKAANQIRYMIKVRKEWKNWGAWNAGPDACNIE